MTGRCQTPGGKTWAKTGVTAGGDWQSHAACRLEDAHRFTPERTPPKTELDALAAICGTCPVQLQCALFALHNNHSGFFAGIWIADSGPQHATGRTSLRRRIQGKTP